MTENAGEDHASNIIEIIDDLIASVETTGSTEARAERARVERYNADRTRLKAGLE